MAVIQFLAFDRKAIYTFSQLAKSEPVFSRKKFEKKMIGSHIAHREKSRARVQRCTGVIKGWR